jgi:hypothetical protein
MDGWMNFKVMISSYVLTLGCVIATPPAPCLPSFFFKALFKALVDEKTLHHIPIEINRMKKII